VTIELFCLGRFNHRRCQRVVPEERQK
jgi:hypothetical protein